MGISKLQYHKAKSRDDAAYACCGPWRKLKLNNRASIKNENFEGLWLKTSPFKSN